MRSVNFTVIYDFDAPAKVVWDELVDWAGHARWIPATRVEVAPGDPLAVGAEFTAWTGAGPLALKDHMRVAQVDWEDTTSSGTCTVDKLGPILIGTAGFTVTPQGDGARLEWLEDVDVRRLPSFLAPVAAKIGATGFRFGMRNLAKQLASRAVAS